jgi:tungstate transport system ATP-binding protein
MNKQYQLNNIKFSYANKLILDIQQQHFEQGKITALIGENGAGKSTLLGLLSFILPIQSGEIEFSGEKVNKNEWATLRKSVGLVQQNPYLIKGSVIRNIELGLKFRGIEPVERKVKVRNMLRLLRIENLAERSVKSLSGGEAQKVAIGRALVLDPEVILLDEPFTYLDSDFVEEFESLIIQLRDEHNKTILFTSHNQSQARGLSDQVFCLAKGTLAEV